ncbi:RNA-directed DNA polymerase, eukaryota, reverse transcriptase zinc-binding domain protein [Tanacetum coccineum]
MLNTSSESFLGPTISAMGIVHPPGLVFHWAWRKELRYAPEIADLGDMVSLLSQLHLSHMQDTWTCTIDNSRMFSVKSICSLITHMSTSLVDQPIRWNKGLPSKVNILTWRVLNRRLPTRVNIDRRGIDIDSIRCPICDGDLESEDHLFVSCVIAVEIWKNILDWWGISNVGINNLYDVINLADRVPLEPKHSNFFEVVVQTAIWNVILNFLRSTTKHDLLSSSRDLLPTCDLVTLGQHACTVLDVESVLHSDILCDVIQRDESLRVLIWSVWVPFPDAGFGSLWLGDVDLLLVTFNSELKIFDSLLNNQASGEHS